MPGSVKFLNAGEQAIEIGELLVTPHPAGHLVARLLADGQPVEMPRMDLVKARRVDLHRPPGRSVIGRAREVMIGLPAVGRHQMPGEKPSDQPRELLALGSRQLVPELVLGPAPSRAIQRRGGAWMGMSLRMESLLPVGGAAGTIGSVRAAPWQRL
jgi:hypothetical protein